MFPKGSHAGKMDSNTAMLQGGNSEVSEPSGVIGVLPGVSWLLWDWTILNRGYPTIWPLPHAPTHHT